MSDLTNHEFACLLLADDGESLIPIGIWKQPIERLIALGFLKKLDGANHVITEAGHAARVARDENDGAELSRLLSRSKETDEDRTADRRIDPHDGVDLEAPVAGSPKVGLGDE